jgi:hypothetical protein
MAEKMDIDESRRIVQQGDFSLEPHPGGHEPTWTDGLPHDFSGWGPQTPDPQKPSPAIDLTWTGQGGDRGCHVWKFDGRRHH